MPQFDLTTYSSQIFWFVICFAVLYYSLHFIIIPRIRNISLEREKIIENDSSLANKIDSEIESLNLKSNSLRKEASKKYQAQLEESLKLAVKERDKSTQDLKDKIEEMTKKSQNEISDFVKNSQDKVALAAKELTQIIKTKIFG